MKQRLRSTAAAALVLLAPAATFLVAQPAAAQQRAANQISNLTVNSDAGISPGATLRFQMTGTPRARQARLTVPGLDKQVALQETSAGTYTGTYTVRRSDTPDVNTQIAAHLTHGSATLTRRFNWPAGFQALGMGAAPAASPAIERFVMRPMGRIEAGRELNFRLRGAPGGDAWMDIPGVINGVDLAETRPGVYEGSYTVRRRDDPDAFERAVATLRNGNARATARLDLRGGDRDWGPPPVARDDRAPQITDLTPAHGDRIGERGRTHLSARISDEGSGIDTNGVRLRLAGRDVTSDARITSDEVNYRADLPPGRYTAELAVKDRAGNQTTKTWTFDIVDRDRADNRDNRGDRERTTTYGNIPLEVTSHRNNAVVDANGNLTIQGRTAPHATVRLQVESVANVGGLLGVTQPVADVTVQADRNGVFSAGIQPRGGLPIPGTRYDVKLTSTFGSQTAEERITLMRRQG